VHGDGGNDSLILYDDNATGAVNYSATDTRIDRSGAAPTFYATTETLRLRPGSGTNAINVLETVPSVPISLDPSAGNDTLNVNTDGAGTAAVRFDATQTFGAVNIGAGGKAILASAATANSRAIVTGTVQINNGGALDLGNGAMIVNYLTTSPLGAIRNYIRTGRNNGNWNGSGITSSAAQASKPANKTLGVMESSDYFGLYGNGAAFAGQPIDSTCVLIKYTYYGDADFNGKVNFDDYVRTDNGFNNHSSQWKDGDFDGNGQVNFDDYVLIDLAFNTQSGML
jgi:hypothetical protein